MKKLLLFIFLIFITKSIMALSLKTQIIINASPDQVWSILMDFDSYPDWNPFIVSLKGEPVVGEKLEAEIDGMKFKPKILVNQKNNQLLWEGKLLIKGLFDGRHNFRLMDNGDGTTTFIQSEDFSGSLVPIFKKKLTNNTKAGFEKMNMALKKKTEKLFNPVLQ